MCCGATIGMAWEYVVMYVECARRFRRGVAGTGCNCICMCVCKYVGMMYVRMYVRLHVVMLFFSGHIHG